MVALVGGQPVDFARFATVLVVARLLADAGPRLGSFRGGFVPVMGCAVVLALVLGLQPDLGNAFSIPALCAMTAVVAGVRVRWFAVFGLPLLAIGVSAALSHDYVMARVEGFFGQAPGYQVEQSRLALAAGGMFGRGIGARMMKFGAVPYADNDFVFAMVGEELGFVGTCAVLAAYAAIGIAGLRLFATCADPFARYLIFGFTAALLLQATFNLSVVTGVVPPKGIDLPLVSSGGTNLVFCLAGLGVLAGAARSACPTAGHSPGRDSKRWDSSNVTDSTCSAW